MEESQLIHGPTIAKRRKSSFLIRIRISVIEGHSDRNLHFEDLHFIFRGTSPTFQGIGDRLQIQLIKAITRISTLFSFARSSSVYNAAATLSDLEQSWQYVSTCHKGTPGPFAQCDSVNT